MDRHLSRGCPLAAGQKIRSLRCEGPDWAIYETDNDCLVLTILENLLTFWLDGYGLQKDLFSPLGDIFYRIAPEETLISSLCKGPYPQNLKQIRGLSPVLKEFRRLHPQTPPGDAIFLEVPGCLLPVLGPEESSYETLYGRWITGGVNLSIEKMDRISGILSWLPADALEDCASSAGFRVKPTEAAPRDPKVPQQPSPSRETDRKVPETTFSLPGRPALEQFFNDSIVDIVRKPEQYRRMGISFPGATILYGPPGCGKTYAVDRLAEYLGWPRIDISSGTVGSSYIHETSKKISEIFDAAIAAAPSLLVIDEMEAFLSQRSGTGPSGLHHMEEVGEFLRCIPRAVSAGVLIFAMTNLIDSIDPAILRRGRFDHRIEITMPSQQEVLALLKLRFQALPVDETVDAGKLSALLAGHPMSDVTFVLREAGRLAVKQSLDFISMDCLLEAVSSLPEEKSAKPIGFQV